MPRSRSARLQLERLESRDTPNTAGITMPGTNVYPNGGMRRIAGTILSDPNYRSLYNGLIDPTTGYGYFSTAAALNPGRVIKVDLRGSQPIEVGATPVGSGDINLDSGVLDSSDPDPARHYAYFGTTTSPGRIAKVKLGVDNAPPTYLGTVTLQSPPLEGSVF